MKNPLLNKKPQSGWFADMVQAMQEAAETKPSITDRLATVERRLDDIQKPNLPMSQAIHAATPEHKVRTYKCASPNCTGHLGESGGQTQKFEYGTIQGFQPKLSPRTITPELLEQAASGMFLKWTTTQRAVIALRLNRLILTQKVDDNG